MSRPRKGVRAVTAGVLGKIRKHRVSYLFMAPYLVLFAVFFIIPVGIAIYLSFNYFNILEPPRWIGLANYRLLFLEDDVFGKAILNTFLFALIAGPVGYFASFILAWMINQIRLRTVYALIFYAPSILNSIAVGIIWIYFFSSDRYGLLNTLLSRLKLLEEPMLWLQDIRTILPVIMFVAAWMSMGTGFLAFLAGLKNVPLELYEAGKVDGITSRWQEIRYITLPVMKPMLLFGAVLTVVNSFNVFGISQALVGFPSPLDAGLTIVGHLYDYAFIRYEMGYASGISVVLFVVTFGLGRLFMRVFSTRGE